MANVTAPQFQQDVNNAADWANGDENATVTMRLGQQADSPAKVIKRVDDLAEAQRDSIDALAAAQRNNIDTLAAAQREDIYEKVTPSVKGTFEDGFTFEDLFERGKFGTEPNETYWAFTGGTAGLPHVVTAGTDPTLGGPYEQVTLNVASDISVSDGGSVQDYINENLTPFKTVAAMRSYDYTSILDGSRIEWQGYHSQSDGGSNWGLLKKGDSTSLVDDGGSIFVIVNDAVNGVWIEANLKGSKVSIKKFGAYVDGVTDDSNFIDAAIATKLNLRFPGGGCAITRSIDPHPAQELVGDSRPQRNQYINKPVSYLMCMGNAHGIDFTVNNANGAAVRKLAIRNLSGSTDKTGVRLGEIGSTDGSTESLKFLVEDVLNIGFSTAFGVYDYSWGGTFRRCVADRFLNYGFDIRRAANVTGLYDCESILGSLADTGIGANVDEAFSVSFYNHRFENNRVALQVTGGATVSVYTPYLEGNRLFDYIIKDPETTLTIHNTINLHANNGQNTTAIFSAQNTDLTTTLLVYGINLSVSDGVVGNDNSLTYFYEGQTICNTKIYDVTWKAKASSISATYAPVDLTFSELTNTRFGMRSKALPTQLIGIADKSSSGSPADDSLFEITNLDGTKTVVGKANGAKVIHNDNGTVDHRFYSGGQWVAVFRRFDNGQPEQAAKTEFDDIANDINTVDKYTGKEVWSTSAGKPVYATGSSASAPWNNSDGTVYSTPV